MSSANKNDIKTAIRKMSIPGILFLNQCIFCDMRNAIDKNSSTNEKNFNEETSWVFDHRQFLPVQIVKLHISYSVVSPEWFFRCFRTFSKLIICS